MLTVRRILALLILLAVILLGLVVWRHLQQAPLQEVLEALSPEIDLALDHLNYTETQDGRKRWTLVADRAEYLRAGNLVRLTPVQLTFYEAGAFGDLGLTADHGELQEDTRQVDVWGGVVIVGEGGERLQTETLRYQDQQRLLSTAAPIHYQAPRMELTGVGLVIDLQKNTMLVKKDVRMLLLPEPQENSGEN
ncbi:LPS export ABC transporter periplasmic protein LptC [Pelovirga terrestris]|uniref:LPS export ABC transporter periplasmic protein LptC n=1 Tax=Pelovirga terrestris TaxID=2771352 RepID=A0A8J6URN8_9BACT|nr:LPS export ABC transporter periplasmic protein LptC [Pelovirga terrestris]MBD1401641.1 LPS export ABC transporter periplasmic protein LptC [Pelovirga terrestris]